MEQLAPPIEAIWRGSESIMERFGGPTCLLRSLITRFWEVWAASKSRPSRLTYSRTDPRSMRELFRGVTSKGTSGGCTYRARGISRHGGTLRLGRFEKLALPALNACGNYSEGSLRRVHPADVPTGHEESRSMRELRGGMGIGALRSPPAAFLRRRDGGDVQSTLGWAWAVRQ